MRNTWAQKLYDEMMSFENIEDVAKMFNGTKYMAKNDVGAIIGELIGTYDMSKTDILKTVLTSKKYEDNMDCVTEEDNPIIIALLKAYFNNIRNGNVRNKTLMKSFIFDKTFKYKWDVTNKKGETPFDVIFDNCDLLAFSDYPIFFNKENQMHFSPLNKTIGEKSFMEVFKETNGLKNKTEIKKIMQFFKKIADEQTITILSDCYA